MLMNAPNLVLDLGQIRSDARNGKLSIEQLLDIVEQQQLTIKRLDADKRRLTQRLAQYEPEVAREANTQTQTANTQTQTTNPPNRNESYSLDAEEQRRQQRSGGRRRQKSPGRAPTEETFAAAQKYEDVYPDGVDPAKCHLVRERAVWRLLDGKAMRVGYRIYAGPDGKEPPIPGVTPRCEYGIEILVVLAFLVYLIGISLDKACVVLGFFCQLPLAKSQADALLRQLAQHWDGEYDILCDLLAHAAVVYMDETGWKVGDEKCALWAFAAQLHRVFLFGCHKDAETLDAMLPPDVFTGTGVSDDAAVYENRFTTGQKCWAHLLRKAIKLALLYPDNATYQSFLDGLLAIYRDAKKSAADGRLGETGRKQRVVALETRLRELLAPYLPETAEETSEMSPHEQTLTNLVNELARLAIAEELFTFVLNPEVEGTNNRMERELRPPALDRKAGRTNKNAKGAHRRSVIVSVLQSLKANLENFSLTNVLEEVCRWMKDGLSLFAKQWHAMQDAEAARNTG
jgi:transposase